MNVWKLKQANKMIFEIKLILNNLRLFHILINSFMNYLSVFT
jgi:hypothetical protein